MTEDAVTIRVRYPEVDRMGFAHHTAYLVWFEVGRTEWLRARGLTYRELEDERGVRLPLVAARLNFKRPARYDDLIEVRTGLELLSPVRIRFEYRIHERESGALLATGETVHAAVDAAGRPRRLPPALQEKLARC